MLLFTEKLTEVPLDMHRHEPWLGLPNAPGKCAHCCHLVHEKACFNTLIKLNVDFFSNGGK